MPSAWGGAAQEAERLQLVIFGEGSAFGSCLASLAGTWALQTASGTGHPRERLLVLARAASSPCACAAPVNGNRCGRSLVGVLLT